MSPSSDEVYRQRITVCLNESREWVDTHPVVPPGNFEKGKKEEQSAINQGPNKSTRNKIAALEAALKRIDEGTFGICDKCGKRIPEDRLDARLDANDCIDCHKKKSQGIKTYQPANP